MTGRALALVVAALALCVVGAAQAEGLSQIVEYHSPLDDSTQAYGVYVPDCPPPSSAGYPAVLHGHGYGWSVSKSFSAFQRQWADEYGWVLIHLNARGPNFYEGVGDVETLRVVDDAAARFGLDRDRIYMTGGSMGGTGALRHGLRHPDVFAAVMGVDGWTDYRLWHNHWYARTDCRDLIEEFRRPLLQAASPLYWPERGRWGAIGHIVDGSDTIVWPENGIRLREALLELSADAPGAYDHAMIFNPLLGHGRGTNYRAIYEFFVGRRRIKMPAGFSVQSTVLPHAELYWGRIDDFLIDGMSGTLQVRATDDGVAVTTENVAAFTLYLAGSPVADADSVRVYADGLACYDGPPATISVRATLDHSGAVVDWRPADEPRRLRKRPELCGPVGDAFLRPFAVVYGTAGTAEDVRRHRTEAEQFARSWNDFNVHAEAVEAMPEQALDPADAATHTLVVFGTLDSSAILRRAHARQQFPVEVRRDRVIVRDPLRGDRRYVGEKFGALMCYPNPLTDNETYIVIANRRVFMKPDGTDLQLLGYDLEKLPWAYPDYVVFNNDQSELPHTLNVNNKPPVTCYEAAYFTEAGFFDDGWSIDRFGQLRRVRAQRPEDHRLVHVAELRADGEAAVVTILDADDRPVHTARVTGRWAGDGEFVASTLTNENGQARFQLPDTMPTGSGFEIVNVMATGCTYDWTADEARWLSPTGAGLRRIALVSLDDSPRVLPDGSVRLHLAAYNATDAPRSIAITMTAPEGRVLPSEAIVRVAPHAREVVEFNWAPDGGRPGLTMLRAHATSPGEVHAVADCEVPVRVMPPRGPLVVTRVAAADIEWGQPWTVTATVSSWANAETIEATVHCVALEPGRFAEPKTITLPAGEAVTVEWTCDSVLPKGEHTAIVSVEGAAAAGSDCFAVR